METMNEACAFLAANCLTPKAVAFADHSRKKTVFWRLSDHRRVFLSGAHER